MKALAAALLSLLVWVSAGAAHAQEVRVTLNDVEPRAGKILVSLQTEAQFMRGQGAYSLMLDPPAAKGALVAVFANVAPGEYAMSAMHDENGDYQMRTNDAGMPLEGYAMSHMGSLMGPPQFSVNKFTVADAPVSFSEDMYYPYVPPGQ